jgi:hypothetical protein
MSSYLSNSRVKSGSCRTTTLLNYLASFDNPGVSGKVLE